MIFFGPLALIYWTGISDRSLTDRLLRYDVLLAKLSCEVLFLCAMFSGPLLVALRVPRGTEVNWSSFVLRSGFAWASAGVCSFAGAFVAVSVPKLHPDGYSLILCTVIAVTGLACAGCLAVAWWRFRRVRDNDALLPPRDFTIDSDILAAGPDFPMRLSAVKAVEDARDIADSIGYRASIFKLLGTGLMLAGGAFFATTILWAFAGDPSARLLVVLIPFGLWFCGYSLTSRAGKLEASAERLRQHAMSML